jgi:hypothetical protein
MGTFASNSQIHKCSLSLNAMCDVWCTMLLLQFTHIIFKDFLLTGYYIFRNLILANFI